MQKSKKITHDIELIVVDDLLKFVPKTKRGSAYLSAYDLSDRLFSNGNMFITDDAVNAALVQLRENEIITLETF
jgi:hypothetical protein|tara:strand:+ start:530 stop:751 length:222 start_codon:yes stop_codon:yes gene_type:complete